MTQTVYVALSGTRQEGSYLLGVASTAEKAKAICQKNHEFREETDVLDWKDLLADTSGSEYYLVKAEVVDAHELDRAYFAA